MRLVAFHLPVLNVTASLSAGPWAVSKFAVPFGDFDLLVKTGGEVETKVIPIVAKGSCSTEYSLPRLLIPRSLAFAPVEY
jgi:hypothetical protein